MIRRDDGGEQEGGYAELHRHKDRVEIRGMGGAAWIRIGGWVGWLRADG